MSDSKKISKTYSEPAKNPRIPRVRQVEKDDVTTVKTRFFPSDSGSDTVL